MIPSTDKFAEWLRDAEHNTPQDVYSWTPYKITSYDVEGSSINVEYEFLTVDPYLENYQMFEMCEEGIEGYKFPKFINKIKLKEKYTWGDAGKLSELTSDYLRENIDVEYEDVPWDSQDLTNDFLGYVVDYYDRDSIGRALVEIYKADVQMPDFVPERLKPLFSQCVKAYLGSK